MATSTAARVVRLQLKIGRLDGVQSYLQPVTENHCFGALCTADAQEGVFATELRSWRNIKVLPWPRRGVEDWVMAWPLLLCW